MSVGSHCGLQECLPGEHWLAVNNGTVGDWAGKNAFRWFSSVSAACNTVAR